MSEILIDITAIAKDYAVKCHADTNHLYDGKPYFVHLDMVFQCAVKFKGLIPESARDNVLASCWTHDVIEDCRQTYNDVLKATNETVADLTYVLTNEKGRNRKERENDKYYAGIRATPCATFVKLCDRTANVAYSLMNGSRMYEMYKKENQHFVASLYKEKYKLMFDFLDLTLNAKK